MSLNALYMYLFPGRPRRGCLNAHHVKLDFTLGSRPPSICDQKWPPMPLVPLPCSEVQRSRSIPCPCAKTRLHCCRHYPSRQSDKFLGRLPSLMTRRLSFSCCASHKLGAFRPVIGLEVSSFSTSQHSQDEKSSFVLSVRGDLATTPISQQSSRSEFEHPTATLVSHKLSHKECCHGWLPACRFPDLRLTQSRSSPQHSHEQSTGRDRLKGTVACGLWPPRWFHAAR